MAELYDVDREEDKTMRKKEECNFNLLFQTILLQEIMDEKNIEDRDIEDAITDMMEGFKRFEFPDMEQWENVCGYLFRYGPHGAGLTRNRVLEAVRNNEDLASCLLKREDLNIVSLGGGPGNDIIGFGSALFEYVQKSQHEYKLRNLNITVIDKYENWSICVDHLKKLVLENEFGNVSELFRLIDVAISFLQVNISPGLWDKDYFHFLRNADVILMVKLISSLDLRNIDFLTMTLIRTMKDDALVLYIDKTFHRRVIDHFEVLFRSNLGDYCMCTETNKRFNSYDDVTSGAEIAVLRKRRA